MENADLGTLLQERKLRAELRVEGTQLRAEEMAGQAMKKALSRVGFKKRSFDRLKSRLSGFDDDSLRAILVNIGAVRFEATDGTELWGLVERNEEGM